VSKVVISLVAALALLLPTAPVANAADQRVTRTEYRNAHDAWRIEGLDRRGIRIYFGYDGVRKSQSTRRMTRTYLGWTDEKHIDVAFRRSNRKAPWMVMNMGVRTVADCVTTAEWTAAYGEAVGMIGIGKFFETQGTVITLEDAPYPKQVRRYRACLQAGSYEVAFTHNGDEYWFTPSAGVFTGE
jgi:hypothetical protein